jgi:hypothetical protein
MPDPGPVPGPGHGEKLTRKQEQAIAALLANATLKRAATAIGLSEKTLRNWLRLPHFLGEYRQQRREIVEQTVAVAQGLLLKAMSTLGRNLDCGNKAAENRAAVAILEHATKGVELADLLERIEELERLTLARRRA